jgi:hypothetical protein
MNTTKKGRRRGKDLLRCFHCGRRLNMDQASAWFYLIELEEILYCDGCVREHNEAIARTGLPQPMTLHYAPSGLLEFMAAKYGAEKIPFEDD